MKMSSNRIAPRTGARPMALKAAAPRPAPTLQQRAQALISGRAMKEILKKRAVVSPTRARAMRNRPSLVQPRTTRKAR